MKVNTGAKWGKSKVPKLRQISTGASSNNAPATSRDYGQRNRVQYADVKRSGSLSARESFAYQKSANNTNKTKRIIKNVNTRTALAAKIKKDKAQQIEYERKVAVQRIASTNVKKRQPQKAKKQKIRMNNVTKAITPRFGRAREKKVKRKKGDGLKSHVKVYRDIATINAACNGDPYEGQRAQVCLATPKPSAGFKLVWMW